MDEPSGGTPERGAVDIDQIGRQMVLALLSPGAGDGPDQALVRDVGAFLGQAIGAGLDQLVYAGVGETPEEALRVALNLPVETVPAGQLTETAASLLALRVQSEVNAAVPSGPLGGGPQAAVDEGSLESADRKDLNAAGIGAGVGAWTLGKAKEWLDACLKTFDEDYVNTWDKRFAFAQQWDTVFNAASLGPFVETPTMEDGDLVHRELQARFLREYGPGATRPTAEILIERTIHRPSGPISLSKARKESKLYRRLWLALRSPKTRTGSLRLDLASLSSFTIWEVKPVGNLAGGVVQLFYYCSAYNCLAGTQNSPERLAHSAVPLARSVLWPVKLPSSGQGGAARPRFAVPFQVPQCPGVVGYVVLVLPSLKGTVDAAALAALLGHFRQLSRRMRKLRGSLQGEAANDDIESDFPVAALVMMVGFILIVGIALVAGPAVLATLAAVSAKTAATGAAVGTLLLGTAALAAEDPTGQTSPASTHPVTEGSNEPVTLYTFAGNITAGSQHDAFLSVAAICSTLWLGLSRPPAGESNAASP